MKKVIFAIIAIVLIGGAWYVKNNTGPENLQETNFDKAIKIMNNLQSRAVQTEVTNENMRILEEAYTDAQERKSKVDSFRTTDINKLTTKLTSLGISSAQIKIIIDVSKGRKDVYLSTETDGIQNKLDSLPSNITSEQKNEIRAMCDIINNFSTDIQLLNLYINWYATKRPNICTTNGPTFDPYSVGTISFRYRTASLSDTCQNNNEKVKEIRCNNFVYDETQTTPNTAGEVNVNASVRIVDCAYGCNQGKCNKGTLGTSIKAYRNATTTSEETDIDLAETFYLRVSPAKATNASGTLTVNIASPSLTNNRCTLAGNVTTQTLGTTVTNINFGAITCQTAGNHDFTITLKEGNETIHTLTKRISVGTVTMKEFRFTKLNGQDITDTPTVEKNTPFSLTVQTIGTNEEPYANYTKKFYVLVLGDDDRTIPEAGQSMNGSDLKTLSGIKFTQTGEITLTVRSEDSAFEKSIKINVTE